MGREFELKFAATEAQQAEILRDFPGDWRSIAMETTYYDTPDGALGHRRWTLRRRFENGVSVCTVKIPAPGGSCGEWEVECPAIEDAISELCKLGSPEELRTLTAAGVIPVCGAKFTRQALTVTQEGCTVELALDRGILLGGGREMALCEIEAELKSGTDADAMAFGQILARKYGLRPETRSKYRRALLLAKGEI